MVTFSETEQQISISQIENIENGIGLRFPMEYKEHLLKYNGGRFEPDIFRIIDHGKTDYSNVDWFLAIYDGESDNLWRHIEICKVYEKRMPSPILPIAHDPGGNLICISCGDKDYGCIYFWDHEKEVDYSVSDDNDYSNLYLIDKSFDEFLNNLKTEEDIKSN